MMSESSKTNILVLCVFQEMGEAFLQSLDPAASGAEADLTLSERPVHLEVLAGDPRVNASWEEKCGEADGLLLLVRFMDVISMDKTKAIFRKVPSTQADSLSVLLFREEGETDFKMSCAACGQKLWVRDQDVGKRGRCPNCKRAFRLPGQEEHLKSQLLVPDAMTVKTVSRGDAEACRAVVAELAGKLSGGIRDEASFDPNVLKQSTVRIDISSGDTTTDQP